MPAHIERRDIRGHQGAWGIWERIVPNLIVDGDAPGQPMFHGNVSVLTEKCLSA